VAGTVSYTYGPQQQGYNNWGVSAHTNTVMDARGSLFTSIFQLSSDVEGDLVGMTATGPAFTVGVRLSPEDFGNAKGLDLDESVQVARWLAEDGVDFVHLSLWRALLVGDRHHAWMYDGRSLSRLLADHGFLGPGVLAPGETTIADPGALDLCERADESVYVEARKP